MAGNGQLVAANFIQSQKNKNILVDAKQYEYRQKTKSGARTYWECRLIEKKTCKASAISVCIDGVEYIKQLKVYKI